MPKNLTETDTYESDVTVPVDLDARNAASVETGFQQLANRTHWLKAAADVVDPNRTGGLRVRRVSSPITMSLLDDMADGEMVAAKYTMGSMASGYGLWIYDATSTLDQDLPMIVEPASGVGRWVHVSAPVAETPDGLCQYNADGVVSPSRIAFGRQGFAHQHSLGPTGFTGTGPHVAANVHIDVPTTGTWYPWIRAWCRLYTSSGDRWAYAELWYDTTNHSRSLSYNSTPGYVEISAFPELTLTSGAHWFYLKLAGETGDTQLYVAEYGITVEMLANYNP